jgi:hypothetical protein
MRRIERTERLCLVLRISLKYPQTHQYKGAFLTQRPDSADGVREHAIQG